MRNQQIEQSINFMEFVLTKATTSKDIEWCITELFNLNNLLMLNLED